MGIRFSCHGCSKPLNIKNDLAGRRGRCPECSIRFRIPLTDAEFSTPLEKNRPANAESQAAAPTQGSRPSDVLGVTGQDAVVPQSSSGQSSSGQSDVGVQATLVAAPKPTSGDEIDLLASDPTAAWYVRPPSGGQYGPADADVLQGWIDEGRVAKTALIWRDGWPQWREAVAAFPEIAKSLPGSANGDSNDIFPDGIGASTLPAPISVEKTTRVVSSDLAGDAKIGAARQKRSSRRVTLVAVLATLVVALIATLVIVASTRG